MLPLLPAFEGEIGTSTGTSIQAVVHWNYSSICRGGNSLLERLVLAGGRLCLHLYLQCTVPYLYLVRRTLHIDINSHFRCFL